jgi:ketosteroid isomerase-like protein
MGVSVLTVDDQLAIQQLVARYSHAIDGGDGVAYAGTFVEDGVLDAGALQVEGSHALEQFATEFPNSVRSPRHVATNLVIDGTGDGATCKAYVQLFAMVGEPPRHQVTAAGVYDDTLSKADGTWRFVRRTFIPDR